MKLYRPIDVFLRRGSRVYRVSVVQPGVGSTVSEVKRQAGFRLVGEIACGLPESGCAMGPRFGGQASF